MEKKALNRVLTGAEVLMMAFGAMIGWGWVVSSGEWIGSAGALGTVIGFIIGGITIYFVGLCYAELTSAMPSGGELLFSYKALGKNTAFICSWFMILSFVGVVCFEACSLPTIIQYIFPGFLKGYLYTVAGFDVYLSWLLLASAIAAFITYLNIKGLKAAMKLQTALTAVIGLVGIVLVASSAINGDASNLSGQFFVSDNAAANIKGCLSVAAVAPFFLFGFDVIPKAAEEINVPLKKVGKILVLSIILAVSFYALVVLATGYALDKTSIENSSQGLGLAAADAMARMFNSKAMANVIIIGGICGVVTSWNSFLIGGSRALYYMARAKMIPSFLGRLHPHYNSPSNAIILIGAISLIAPFFGKHMLSWISEASSFACCVAYFISSLSFLVLRKKEPDMERPFKVKHWKGVGFTALLLSGFMVLSFIIPGAGASLGRQEWFIILLWLVLGLGFYTASRIKFKEYFGLIA